MARKNSNRPHANWDIPGGIRTLDGSPVQATYRTQNAASVAHQKKAHHNSAMAKLRKQQAKMSTI